MLYWLSFVLPAFLLYFSSKLNIEKGFLNIVNKISSFLFLFFAGSLFYTAYKAFQIMPLTK